VSVTDFLKKDISFKRNSSPKAKAEAPKAETEAPQAEAETETAQQKPARKRSLSLPKSGRKPKQAKTASTRSNGLAGARWT